MLFFAAKKLPFEVTFLSDNSEFVDADEIDVAKTNSGFKLAWFQDGGC